MIWESTKREDGELAAMPAKSSRLGFAEPVLYHEYISLNLFSATSEIVECFKDVILECSKGAFWMF